MRSSPAFALSCSPGLTTSSGKDHPTPRNGLDIAFLSDKDRAYRDDLPGRQVGRVIARRSDVAVSRGLLAVDQHRGASDLNRCLVSGRLLKREARSHWDVGGRIAGRASLDGRRQAHDFHIAAESAVYQTHKRMRQRSRRLTRAGLNHDDVRIDGYDFVALFSSRLSHN